MGIICGVSYCGGSGLDPDSISWTQTYRVGEADQNPNSDSHTISLNPNSLYLVMVLNDSIATLNNAKLIWGTNGINSVRLGFTANGAEYGDTVYTYILKTEDLQGSITLESGHITVARIFDTNA